jgi:predicted nucleic acid-binding protein
VSDEVLCLDTSVIIKYLTPESGGEVAAALVTRGFGQSAGLVAPAWAWAEVGSVLRKKVRTGVLGSADAGSIWADFLDLPILQVESTLLKRRSWEIAERFGLHTLYDAAFLACTEIAPPGDARRREFWTADARLVRHLSIDLPEYVHFLQD